MRNNFTDQQEHMTHCYSSNQIILFLYGELQALESLETENAVKTSTEWKEKYKAIKESINRLPKVQFFPRGRVLKSILKYSESVK